MHVTVADFLSWTQQHPKTPGGKTQEVQSTNQYQRAAQMQPAFSLQSRDGQETGRRKQLNESNCTFTRYEMLKLSNSVRWCWWTMINNHQNKLQHPELRKVRTGNYFLSCTEYLCNSCLLWLEQRTAPTAARCPPEDPDKHTWPFKDVSSHWSLTNKTSIKSVMLLLILKWQWTKSWRLRLHLRRSGNKCSGVLLTSRCPAPCYTSVGLKPRPSFGQTVSAWSRTFLCP